MSQRNKSVLFNTSTGADVQFSGGDILIAGLDPINQDQLVDISQVNFRAEVQQVVTIGATAYTPAANVTYGVTIGDVSRTDKGYTENLKRFIYKTPSDITTIGANAAAQREFIHGQIIAKINLSTGGSYVTAATLTGGNGFTVTDVAGYFPNNRQGVNNRRGASTVRPFQNTDGTGFAASNFVLTTPAVYEFGTGALLQNNVLSYDFVTGNLLSGDWDAPVTIANAPAVTGQRYNAFSFSFTRRVSLPTSHNGTAYGVLFVNQTVFVDNGTGTSTANLAGYISFERSIHRAIAIYHFKDANTQADFFDNVILFQGPAGAVPATTGETKMLSDAKWVFNNIGTNVITVPTPSNAGLVLDQTLTATQGSEYTPSLLTLSPKEFTVGKTDITVFARVQAATIANCAWMVGLRVKAAHSATFAYNGIAAIGSAAATPTVASTFGSLNGTVVTTSTGLTISNAVNYAVQVLVNRAGVVTVKINDVTYPVYSVGTTPLVFAANTVLIPFFRGVNVGGSAPTLVISELLALPKANVIS